MKRTSAGIAILFLLVLVAAVAIGCTKEKPAGRQPDTAAMASSAITATVVLTAPTVPIGGGVLPTLTPTPRATTIAIPPSATADAGFEELIANEATPTAPAATLAAPGGTPPATPVPVLTLQPQPTATTPIVTPAPTSAPLPPTSTPGGGQPPPGTVYVVRWGDSLSSIAAQFGVTVEAIMSANGMSGDVIVIGQQLIIPLATAPSPGSGGATVTHIVQPGENLFRIALRYDTTVEAITQANGISNPWYIYAGQQLTIPVGPGGNVPPAPGQTYVVQSGDTLGVIAVRFNTTVEALLVANNLSNANMIYVGQVLALP
jgi:LysM repeat protein